MFNHIAGILDSTRPGEAVIDANGVGYVLRIPTSTADVLPAVGQRAKLLAYLHVTQDGMTLFGFATAEERTFFLQLMTVSGVGPKLALAVLSGGRVANIQQAIRLGDYAFLKRIRGVGDGTAKKIVLELGKILVHEPAAEPAAAAKTVKTPAAPQQAPDNLDAFVRDAVSVIIQLQQVPPEVALQAVQRAYSELSAASRRTPLVQDVVQRAMKYTD